MDEESVEKVYAADRHLYEKLAAEVAHVLTTALSQREIRHQPIEFRAKDVEGVAEKLHRPGKKYQGNFLDLPDLAGVRVILYDVGAVDEVARLCAELFSLCEDSHEQNDHSFKSPTEFGYQSLHLVVEMSPERLRLPEWKPFAKRRVEIQIRTVLQHAWAVVSHANQYRQEESVPTSLRRRLNRVAALLELADQEFSGIAHEHTTLRAALEVDAQEGFDSAESLDGPTLEAWIRANESLMASLTEHGRQAGFRFEDDDEEHIGSESAQVVQVGRRLGLSRIDDVISVLEIPPDEQIRYLKEQHAAGDEIWYASAPFLLLLLMVRQYPDLLTAEVLTDIGWDDEIARSVVHVARQGSNPPT